MKVFQFSILNFKFSKGQSLVFAVIIAGVLAILATAAISFSSAELFFSKRSEQRLKALGLAEAGIDKAIFELNQDPNYTGEQNTDLEVGQFSVTVTGSGSNRTIETEGAVPDFQNFKQKRKLRITASVSTENIAFNYGVQVGDGGLQMSNNSRIQGSVYSNGNIQGGNQGSAIDGDAFAAGGSAASLDQEWTSQNAEFTFGQQTPQTDVAQKFIPSKTDVLHSVWILWKRVGSPGNITIRILTDNNGSPSKTSVLNVTIAGSQVPTSLSWLQISMGASTTLTANTPYWLTLDVSNNINNYFVWALDTSDGYLSGTGKYSPNWNTNNPSWTNSGGDFNFKIWLGGSTTSIKSVEIGGSGHANTIDKATVGGNVHCKTLKNSTVGGNAYCDTIQNSVVGGNTFPGEPDPPKLALPISQSSIDQWKADASGGQIINGDYSPPINSTFSLGPAKINGNLLMKNNQTMNLTGTLWVTGNIEVDQNSKIRLDQSYGGNSGVIVSDGWQHLANNGAFLGSGTAGSYILMLSTASGGGHHDSAIDLHNGVDSTIFYAGSGLVNIHQGVTVKEVTAYRLRLEENAVVIYEQGLQNAKFSSGPGGGWQVDAQSWQEIRQ